MSRTIALAALSVCILGGVAASALQQQPTQPTFRAGSDIVRVFTTVTGKDGRLVTNLVQKNFEVRDEGKPQPIEVFDNSPKPIDIVALLDVSGSMEGNLPLLRAAAGQLVQRLRTEDGARIGTFGHEVNISPTFTRNAQELLATLPQAIAPDAPTPLWRAVDEAMNVFKNEDAEKRRIVLVLSDGQDSGITSFKAKFVSPAEIIDRARAEEVMIYAVGMRSRRPTRQMPGLGVEGLQAALAADLPDPALAKVAEETGGGYLEIRYGEDLGSAFTQVADELHSQYLIGYTPPKRDGKTHKIEVKVDQSGMKPRARKTYTAPKD